MCVRKYFFSVLDSIFKTVSNSAYTIWCLRVRVHVIRSTRPFALNNIFVQSLAKRSIQLSKNNIDFIEAIELTVKISIRCNEQLRRNQQLSFAICILIVANDDPKSDVNLFEVHYIPNSHFGIENIQGQCRRVIF